MTRTARTARTARTDGVLRGISEHLHYEVEMLKSLARVLAAGGLGSGTIKDASLEAFILHVRNVMDFLYAHDPYPDDVIAEDFVPSWPASRPKCTTALKIAKARAGKEIAHLTYARLNVAPEEKAWHFLEIATDVSTAFTEFLRQAPKEKLHDCWHGGVPV